MLFYRVVKSDFFSPNINFYGTHKSALSYLINMCFQKYVKIHVIYTWQNGVVTL